MIDRQFDNDLIAALQQHPQNPAAALGPLQSAVDAGDRRAQALRAWMAGQQGQWPEAARLVLELARDGGRIAYLPVYIGQQLVNQPDVAIRAQGVELLQLGLDETSSIDPFATAQQLVQGGFPDGALRLLEGAVSARSDVEREAWHDLVAAARAEASSIGASAAQAEAERDRTFEQMASVQADIERARSDLLGLVEEVGGLAGVAGAAVQANDYGERADAVERRADLFTTLSVLLAALIAGGAAVLAFSAAGSADPLTTALEKSPVSIPLVLLNLYIGRLAANFRDEANRLRHIELQIRSANPFVGGLDDKSRKAILAVLALRFFPGQSPFGSGSSAEPPDLGEALGLLLSGGSRPPSRPPAAEQPPEEA